MMIWKSKWILSFSANNSHRGEYCPWVKLTLPVTDIAPVGKYYTCLGVLPPKMIIVLEGRYCEGWFREQILLLNVNFQLPPLIKKKDLLHMRSSVLLFTYVASLEADAGICLWHSWRHGMSMASEEVTLLYVNGKFWRIEIHLDLRSVIFSYDRSV